MQAPRDKCRCHGVQVPRVAGAMGQVQVPGGQTERSCHGILGVMYCSENN